MLKKLCFGFGEILCSGTIPDNKISVPICYNINTLVPMVSLGPPNIKVR